MPKFIELLPNNEQFLYLDITGGKPKFLTPAERVVMAARALGKTRKEIAADKALSVNGVARSPETVKTHLDEVFKKVNRVIMTTTGLSVPELTDERWGVPVQQGTGFSLYFLWTENILTDRSPYDLVEDTRALIQLIQATKED